MVFLLDIKMKNTKCNVIKELEKELGDMNIEILENKVINGYASHLVKITGEPEKLSQVKKSLLKSRNMRVSIGKLSNKSFLGIIITNPCDICRLSSIDPEIIYLRSFLSVNGTYRIILVTSSKKIDKIIKALKEASGIDVKYTLHKPFKRKNLTPLQAKVLEEAFRLGYYDIPRKIDLIGLAKRLNMSKSTVAEILRRAEAKAIWSLLFEKS